MIPQNISRDVIEWMGNSGATNSNPARLLDTFELFIDPTDRSLCQHMMKDGYWESWTTSWFTRVIEPGMFCVDVGANYGYVTGVMAEMAGDAGLVWSFEPNLNAYRALILSREHNGWQNTHIYRLGLGDRKQTLTLNVPDLYVGGASFIVDTPQGAEESTLVTRQEVAVVPFDTLHVPRKVDLVKIDVEGMEQEVIFGMNDIILRDNPILTIELLPPVLKVLKPGFLEYVFDRWKVFNIDYAGNEVPLTLQECIAGEWWMVVLRDDTMSS